MPNQGAIARALGLTQATVSRALRDAPEIAKATRVRVQKAARDMGYVPNPMVVSLMNRIRDGRGISDHGCIAILCTARPPKPSTSDTVSRQFLGMVQGAEERGFRAEPFYLGDYQMNPKKLFRVLDARGITGIILAPPPLNSKPLPMDMSRHAFATLGSSWSSLPVDRAGINHRSQMDQTMNELLSRGYKRIGFCLPANAQHGVGGAWMDRYLYWQFKLNDQQPLPLFIGKPDDTPAATFKKWFRKWKPDAILGLVGHELKWLDEIGLRAPEDIGLACLNHQTGSPVSGMDENHEVVGQATAGIVISRVLHNKLGLPEHPRLILVDGTWIEGKTLRRRP